MRRFDLFRVIAQSVRVHDYIVWALRDRMSRTVHRVPTFRRSHIGSENSLLGRLERSVFGGAGGGIGFRCSQLR